MSKRIKDHDAAHQMKKIEIDYCKDEIEKTKMKIKNENDI